MGYWRRSIGWPIPALRSSALPALLELQPGSTLMCKAGCFPANQKRTAGTGYIVEIHTAQMITGVALLFWIASQWGMGAPVPWIGAAMWVTDSEWRFFWFASRKQPLSGTSNLGFYLCPGGTGQPAVPGFYRSTLPRTMGSADRVAPKALPR